VTETVVDIRPLTADAWPDLCALFGRNGANSGCWCMWWRVSANEWAAGNDANREGFHDVVDTGEPTGLLAYDDGVPVGWCAVAPRSAYPRILRSPHLKPTDQDEPGVWSVTCFFVKRSHRRQGLRAALLDAAVDYAGRMGATMVEGYPVDTRERPSGDLFTGTVDLFLRSGFFEHLARGGRRVVMRKKP
jgi:GNAT superfamily N-acetyltransferase